MLFRHRLRRRESELYARELDLRERELARPAAVAAPRSMGPQDWAALAAVVVSLVTVLTSMYWTNRELGESRRQFEATIAETRYASILDGLTSDSLSVRAGAIGRLYDFATTGSRSPEEAQDVAVDAMQLLAVLVQEESGDRPREGLAPYFELPSPLITRALARIRDLTRVTGSDGPLVDVNRSDLHGLTLPDVTGTWNGAGSDFRGSWVTGWDLEAGYFSAAFFTCANLATSDLGTANVTGTDFTGADLRGADLSEVTGLTSEQLVGAQMGPTTRLPSGVTAPRVDGGSASPSDCSALLRDMTGLPPGFGYSSTHPCTGAAAAGPVCRFRLRGE